MGNRERFERLVTPVIDQLYRFAVRLTGDPVTAEDLLQVALVRGLDRVGQLHADSAFGAWQSRVLYTTFVNERSRVQRNAVDVGLADSNVLPFERANVEREVSRREVGRFIGDALDGLPPDQREAVWLVDGQGLKFGEAAGVLGIAPGTVASRVARGRLTLRGVLTELAVAEGVIR